VNEKGEEEADAGAIVPVPSVVIATLFAFANVLPSTVTGVTPHVVPVLEDKVTEGPLTHPHSTENSLPVVVHSALFLTVIVWLPLLTFLNLVDDWKLPLSSWYWYPFPVGLDTVTTAAPAPRRQSILTFGEAGDEGWVFMSTRAEEADVQFPESVTLKV
jgi:hypothetical protein